MRNFEFNKIPSHLLGLLLTTEFIFAHVIDGACGVFFLWKT